MSNLFNEYVNKRTAPYVIWTVIAIVVALFFWFTRERQRKEESGDAKKGSRRRRTVCISLSGTVFNTEKSIDGAGDIIDAAVGPFLELCATTEVFAIALATDDAQEEGIRGMLEAIGAFDAGLQGHRLMFSGTTEGRAAMVRQLQPNIHFDATKSVVEALEGKVTELRFVGSETCPTLADGLHQRLMA